MSQGKRTIVSYRYTQDTMAAQEKVSYKEDEKNQWRNHSMVVFNMITDVIRYKGSIIQQKTTGDLA